MLETVGPGIHAWRKFSPEKGLHFNGHLIETPEGPCLIDPPAAPPELFEAIEAIGTPSRILLTNRSHLRATAAFVERFGCPVACHEIERDTVEFEIAETFRTGDGLPGGIEILHLPGKTRGEAGFRLDRGKGILIVGDTVIGRPSGHLAILPEEKLDDPAELRRTVEGMTEIAFETLLVGDGDSILHDAPAALAALLASLPPVSREPDAE
jgi:glyoxylase-like metal-dependent hydrolase (beta-lactamase superfamily II)